MEYVSRNHGTVDPGYPREVYHASEADMRAFEASLITAPTGVAYSHYTISRNRETQTIYSSTAYDANVCERGYEEAARKALPKKRSNHICTPGPGGKCPICRKPSGFHR